MPRTRAPDRLEALVQAGTKVLLEKSYRRAQIADVARAMGVAPGTIYLYVESKEALFDLVLRASVLPDLLAEVKLPISTPAPGSTLAAIREIVKKEGKVVPLKKALKRKEPKGPDELEAIVREMYRKLSRRWLAVKLLERSAQDWPELAKFWFGKRRGKTIRQLTRYFEMAMAGGVLRQVPDPQAAARLVMETVAFFAMHRRLDPYPTEMDELTAEEVVVDAIVHAYVVR